MHYVCKSLYLQCVEPFVLFSAKSIFLGAHSTALRACPEEFEGTGSVETSGYERIPSVRNQISPLRTDTTGPPVEMRTSTERHDPLANDY